MLAYAGNHFNEYAGFECYWHNLPTEEQQRSFLAAYLQRSKQLQGGSDSTVAEAEVHPGMPIDTVHEHALGEVVSRIGLLACWHARHFVLAGVVACCSEHTYPAFSCLQ